MAEPQTEKKLNPDIFIFAGEPSGDLHGEALIQGLLEKDPKLVLAGVGGPRMRNLPFSSIIPMESFQVMGFVDVFLALPKLFYLFYSVAKFILKTNPKVTVFIDYPGFNLRLERHLRKKGFKGKIAHYICPSVWAHGKGRISWMEKSLDLLLCIFPFETKFFSPSFSAEYVGHPLIDRIEALKVEPFAWAKGKEVVAVFPGSRKKEILLNLPLQLKALKKLVSNGFTGAISISQEAFRPLIVSLLQKEQLQDKVILVPSQDNYRLMKHATLALAKSGTVTLELALCLVPTIVTYAIAPLDLFIAQRILRISLPFYCIVNILAEKEVFKELIGPRLSEVSLLEETNKMFCPSYRTEKKESCKKIKEILGKKKASQESARLLLNLLH